MNAFDTIPSQEPDDLVAGDLWQWKRPDLTTDYPTASYDLQYVARIEGGTTDITLTATGGEFTISVPSATTAGYTAGRWHWTAFIVRKSDSERAQIGDGVFVVAPDPANVDTDPRTHAQKTLAAIEALLENRATKLDESYSINGRSLTRLSPEELMNWRAKYRREVRNEKVAAARKAGKSTGRKFAVRFV